MEKIKSFNVTKAIELLRKTNQPRVDAKKKTKFDNMIDLFDALIVQDGRCIIYQRKAFAKIIGVSEMTFRNYLTKLNANGYKLSDVVIDGKNGEKIIKIDRENVDAKPDDKNTDEIIREEPQGDNSNPTDKPDETTANQTVENVDEVQTSTTQPTAVAGFLPTVKKTGGNKTQPQLRADRSNGVTEMPAEGDVKLTANQNDNPTEQVAQTADDQNKALKM